jgi:hypothetical protein
MDAAASGMAVRDIAPEAHPPDIGASATGAVREAEPEATAPLSASQETAAARTERAARAQREKRRPPSAARARRAGLLISALVVAVAAVVAGLVAGRSGSEQRAAPPPSLSGSAADDGLLVRFTPAWRHSTEPPRIPGLAFRRDVSLHLGSGAGLSAGRVAGSGPSLLPPAFLERLPGVPPRTDRVRIGNLAAYRYRGLRPRGYPRPLTLYVVPTTDAVATVACFGASRARVVPDECERVADSLQLLRGRALPLGPDPAYARRLNAGLRRLNAQRAAGSRALRAAGRPRGQAREAARLGAAYRAAHRQFAGIPAGPVEAPTHHRILRALSRGEPAYARLASAARRGQGARYRGARRAVRAADRAVRAAVAELRGLGYRVAR